MEILMQIWVWTVVVFVWTYVALHVAHWMFATKTEGVLSWVLLADILTFLVIGTIWFLDWNQAWPWG